ncbi:hypothetical protein NW768_008045 [Fusarium equiseti]|uniref:PPPDE domain-containing protein n=1 Tax=Fusarium equiseti TaxID=61235 RepID=A0ABQ8R649_FUSEQ|nr:hypothetical protein NW768_008045 [Fusarium equiseti]
MALALGYLFYKLANYGNNTTVPGTKALDPSPPDFQPGRKQQNKSVIADGDASITCGQRDVYIATRVVYGDAGDGLVGRIGKYALMYEDVLLTAGLSLFSRVPDPKHHWVVLVGDYDHQLQADGDGKQLWNYYINERFVDNQGWTKYKLGVTEFNDVAIRNAAAKAMNEMPEGYNFVSNNCQHFALRLLDKILRDGRLKLQTSDTFSGAYALSTCPASWGLVQLLPHQYALAAAAAGTMGINAMGNTQQEQTEGGVGADDPVRAIHVGGNNVTINGPHGDVTTAAAEHIEALDRAVTIMMENTPVWTKAK